MRVVGVTVAIAFVMLLRITSDLRINLRHIGCWIGVDLLDAWRTTNENLTTVNDSRFHRRINRFAHHRARFLSSSKVGLDCLPMFCVECFADAAFAAKESDFLFAHFDFDWSAHRTKLLARHRADALRRCVELIAFCLTFFRNERDVTGVHFLQRSVSIRLDLGDAWWAAHENLLTIDDCRFH